MVWIDPLMLDSDNVNQQRTLFWQIILTNNNTAENCLGLCAEFGYNAGGMEYGEECCEFRKA